VFKVTLVDDTKVNFSNLGVNVVSHSEDLYRNKWWPATKFLHTNQIFENLSLLLFLGEVIYEVCVSDLSAGHQSQFL